MAPKKEYPLREERSTHSSTPAAGPALHPPPGEMRIENEDGVLQTMYPPTIEEEGTLLAHLPTPFAMDMETQQIEEVRQSNRAYIRCTSACMACNFYILYITAPVSSRCMVLHYSTRYYHPNVQIFCPFRPLTMRPFGPAGTCRQLIVDIFFFTTCMVDGRWVHAALEFASVAFLSSWRLNLINT